MRNPKFKDLILNPVTKSQLQALQNNPPHALLFVAPEYSGKLSTALAWSELLTSKELIDVVEPDGASIGIEAVRSLYKSTRSKQSKKQIVIIDHAEAMTTEAQNAFLKLLEEPRADLTFILLSTDRELLLPTIASRIQTIQIRAIEAAQITQTLKETDPSISPELINQIQFMSSGRIAMALSLLHNDDFLKSQLTTMQTAKKLVTASVYERLLLIPDLSKERVATLETLEAMSRMVGLQIGNSADKKWPRLADLIQDCQKNIKQNGNIRAQLTYLFMSF